MFRMTDIHQYTKTENMGFVWVWCAKKSFPVNMDYKSPVKSILIDIRTEDEWKWPQLPAQGKSQIRSKQNSIKEVILATLPFPLLLSNEKQEQRLSSVARQQGAGCWEAGRPEEPTAEAEMDRQQNTTEQPKLLADRVWGADRKEYGVKTLNFMRKDLQRI